MNCDFTREFLSAHIDGELSHSEVCRIQKHLHECQECRRISMHFAALARLVKEDSVPELPGGLLPKVRDRCVDERANFIVCNKPYEKLPGTACFAPYLEVSISSLTGQRAAGISKARIDSGADISSIPRNQVKTLMPLPPGKQVLVRAHDGTIKRANTHLVTISVYGYPGEEQVESYQPERGVLLTDSNTGLIGMDIISEYWNLILDGVSQEFSVERV